jgi:hypothetical protein
MHPQIRPQTWPNQVSSRHLCPSST